MIPSARVTVTRLLAFDNHRHRLSPVNLLLEMDVLPSALKNKPFVYNDKSFMFAIMIRLFAKINKLSIFSSTIINPNHPPHCRPGADVSLAGDLPAVLGCAGQPDHALPRGAARGHGRGAGGGAARPPRRRREVGLHPRAARHRPRQPRQAAARPQPDDTGQ